MAERSQLRVEGRDDNHAIRHLLVRHGLDYDRRPWPAWLPSIESAGGKDDLLDDVQRSIRASSGRAVAFVLDADFPLRDRWRAMSARLSAVGVEVTKNIPHDGFVGESGEYRARVGVWLMPDNRQEGERGEGTLERFLETLVQEADPLLPHAREATRRAKTEHGASYPDGDVKKAVLHAWLAWQKEPGLPYGTAIKARYFRHDSPAARSFVDWFRRVFEAD